MDCHCISLSFQFISATFWKGRKYYIKNVLKHVFTHDSNETEQFSDIFGRYNQWHMIYNQNNAI